MGRPPLAVTNHDSVVPVAAGHDRGAVAPVSTLNAGMVRTPMVGGGGVYAGSKLTTTFLVKVRVLFKVSVAVNNTV